MKVQLADGTRLWFDIEGMGLVPDGDSMHQRPTLILLHGSAWRRVTPVSPAATSF
jgi:hypothetical protein